MQRSTGHASRRSKCIPRAPVHRHVRRSCLRLRPWLRLWRRRPQSSYAGSPGGVARGSASVFGPRPGNVHLPTTYILPSPHLSPCRCAAAAIHIRARRKASQRPEPPVFRLASGPASETSAPPRPHSAVASVGLGRRPSAHAGSRLMAPARFHSGHAASMRTGCRRGMRGDAHPIALARHSTQRRDLLSPLGVHYG